MNMNHGDNQHRLNGPQKAAALMLAMGKENARKVSEHFSSDEMRLLVDAAKKLPGLSVHDVSSLLDEFEQNFERSGISVGASDFESLFTPRKNDGEEQGSAGEERIVIDVATALKFFEGEPAMMSAVLISELDDEVAAQALKELEPEKRSEIMNAFLIRRQLDPELEAALKASILDVVAADAGVGETSEQIEKTVSVITFMDEDDGEALLAAIEAQDPQTAAAIRRSIFRFADIALLDSKAIAKVVDKLETDDITAALSGADAAILEAIMTPLSQRNRKIVESELARGGISAEKTDVARRKIAGIVIGLAKDGVLALPSK